MIIKISPDLKKQEYWANGAELAGIMGRDRQGKKRVLTYPENKKVFVHAFRKPVLLTDNYRIAQLPPTLRDTLFSLCASHPRVVSYDGVSVFWDDSHVGVWCPSIDTILFAKALKKIIKKEKGIQDAVEIGCGSGFISKYLLEKSARVKSILINDINPFAIKCAMDNIKDKRVMFYAGNGLEKIKGKKFDLLLCNPPYVPRKSSIDDNPYEGIGLLNHLVHQGQEYLNDGGMVITNISSLCADIILKQKPEMKMRILERMEVPLKVNNILNNKSWLGYLTKKRGLKKRYRNGYEYWQEIMIVALEK